MGSRHWPHLRFANSILRRKEKGCFTYGLEVGWDMRIDRVSRLFRLVDG
jgi:hypothetical protein